MKHYLFTAATGVKTCNQVVGIRAALMAIRYIQTRISLDGDVHGYYPDFKIRIKRNRGNIAIIASSKGNNTIEFINHCMWFARCKKECEELLIPQLKDRNGRLCNYAGDKRRRYIYSNY